MKMFKSQVCSSPFPMKDANDFGSRNVGNSAGEVSKANEAACKNSESMEIIKKFKKLYEDRLHEVEQAEGDTTEIKLKILKSWVNDLGEQNEMLVQTVDQLEREATNRVVILGKRLQHSSHVAREYMTSLHKFNNQMREMKEKVYCEPLDNKASATLTVAQNEVQQVKITNLQSDISGLLELIRRVRQSGSWNIDGLTFREITYEDIFGDHLYKNSADKKSFPTLQNSDKTDLKANSLVENDQQQEGLMTSVEYHRKDINSKIQQEQVKQQMDDSTKNELLEHFIERAHTFLMKKKQQQQENKCDAYTMTYTCEEIRPLSCVQSELQHAINTVQEYEEEITKLSKKLQGTEAQLYARIAEVAELSMQLKQRDGRIHDLNKTLTEAEKVERIETTNIACRESQEKSVNDQETYNHDNMDTEFHQVLKDTSNINPNKKNISKKGVNFSSFSMDEYEERTPKCQKDLKDQLDLLKEQDGDCLIHAGIHFAKEVGEFRTKTVIAQAALEEMKDEFDNLLQNLKDRENKISHLELMLACLRDTLHLTQNDVKEVSHELNMKNDAGAHAMCLIQEANLENLQHILKVAGIDYNSGDWLQGVTSHEDRELSLKSLMKEITLFIEKLGNREQKVLDMENIVCKLQCNLNKVQLELRNIQEKVEEYCLEEEAFHCSRENGELKLQKLQQELESIQDDLEQYIENLQPAVDSSSDID